MDIISFNEASTANSRIEKINANPDSASGIVTQPKTIASGETVTVPAGRVAVLPNVVVDGTLNIDGEVFIPSGSSVDFSNGIKIDGNNIALSIPTSYHLLQGNLSVSNEIITNGFSTTLYTGNGATQNITTSVDMSTQWGNDVSETFGGLVWVKYRSGTTTAVGHSLNDTVRGGTKAIYTHATTAETTEVTGLLSFNNNGFNIGTSYSTNVVPYASWNFQTTHRRTGITNHGKTITNHFNPFSKFGIAVFTGSGLAGHEISTLLGRKVSLYHIKNISSDTDWFSEHQYDLTTFLKLNRTDAKAAGAIADFTDNSIVLNTGTLPINQAGQTYVVYYWANSYLDETNKLIGNYEVGVYQGTGVAGNKVTTRGKPAWVMVKRLDAIGGWNILDNTRNNFDESISPNLSNAAATVDIIDILSDGLNVKTTVAEWNASGGQYLYMVVYDNDSGSGKSKYPKATDTSNVQINNALIPLAHGVDSNGSKNSILIANETITGLTYTQGKNYLYKTDTGYGVKSYEPRYLSSELVRRYAGESPDYYDVIKNKWFNTDAGSELVSNGTFDINTNGWTAENGATFSQLNGSIGVLSPSGNAAYASQLISNLTIGKKYTAYCYNSYGGTVGRDRGIQIRTSDTSSIVSANYIKTSGLILISFIATQTSHYVYLTVDAISANDYAYFDNISVFATDIVPTTEITESRNYLNHIVYADQNGQVTYVEELPKIEYKDVIKANEYRGKNACTFYANIDMATTPPTVRESYNLATAIRTGNGYLDIYFDDEMDYNSYSIVCCTNDLLLLRDEGGASRQLNKVSLVVATTGGTPTNADNLSIAIFGGRN